MAKKNGMVSQNKRRKELGVEVHQFGDALDVFFSESNSRYIRDLATNPDLVSQFFVGNGHFERSDRMNLLRRSKLFLARRAFADLSECDKPKLYGAKNKIVTVLDCFPSLKYSYSSSLPPRVVMKNHGIPEDFYGRRGPGDVQYFDVCCAPDGSSKKARMSDVSRSANIRLDPMDSPRQLFIYRCRIRRCIAWAYSVGLVPIMMTLTVFHRWNPLRSLLRVISRSWDRFFASGRPAVSRTRRMGVQAYIRRLEETITNGGDFCDYNSGWHPHYHVILFVPADKVSVISDMEDELRSDWFEIVNHFFEMEFGEAIDSSYVDAFKRHGLVFSRYTSFDAVPVFKKSDSHLRLPIRPVDDSEYMAKAFGCSPYVMYSGDSEMTSGYVKNSRIPFDLLCDDTAENNDLWVEYALATKGIRSFVFSRGLSGRVQSYFDSHPKRDTVKSFVRSNEVVAQINSDVYSLLYRTCKVDDMLRAAVKGYDFLCEWFRAFYLKIGYVADDIDEDMLPLPPYTCLPFGDRIDILTFSQTSKLAAESNDVVSDLDSVTATGEPTSGQMSTSSPTLETIQNSTVCSSRHRGNLFRSSATASALKSSSSSSRHPVQLVLQFYPKQSVRRPLFDETMEEQLSILMESTAAASSSSLSINASISSPSTKVGCVGSSASVIDSDVEKSILSRPRKSSTISASRQLSSVAAMSSSRVDSSSDSFDDNSIDARISVVSKSKWYPEWYLQHLMEIKNKGG